MRLFIAIPLPESIRAILYTLGRKIPGARATPAPQLHLTLRFIGETEQEKYREIRQALSAVHTPVFSLSLERTGQFPHHGRPRIIWAGCRENNALMTLHHHIETCLLSCAIARNPAEFTPHITLARCKNTTVHDAARFLQHHGLFKEQCFPVPAFHLFSSQLTPQGAVHTIRKSYPLAKGKG